MQIAAKLEALGLTLPEPPQAPPGITFSFAWTRVRGNRVYMAGHSAQAPDGTYAGPFGKVPSEVSLADARAAVRGSALSILASLKRELGDLDRVTAWLMVSGTSFKELLSIRDDCSFQDLCSRRGHFWAGVPSSVRRSSGPRTCPASVVG